MGAGWGASRGHLCKLPSVLPKGVTEDALPPRAVSCDDLCAVLSSSWLETQRPGFSQGAGLVDTLSQACTQIPDSGRKGCAWHKPHGTNDLGTVSLLPFRECWEPSPSSQTPAKGQPCKQAFLQISSLKPAVFSLFLYNPEK